MSTVPHNPSEVANVVGHSAVLPAARYASEIDRAVREFEAVADELGIPRPSDAELRDLCSKVAGLCTQLFSDEMTIEVRGDPEIAGELHFTFDVVATGSADDIVARSTQWHLKLHQAIGRRAELFCLSFDVR